MSKTLLGGLIAAMLLAIGFYYVQGRAPAPVVAPPPPEVEAADPDTLPDADGAGLRGPEPPEATELTREQRRFARYDRNSDRIITRQEMMASRTKAFRKLDVDGNNLLTFEEWAVATSDRFADADADGNGRLNPEEFATTKPKRAAAAKCSC